MQETVWGSQKSGIPWIRICVDEEHGAVDLPGHGISAECNRASRNYKKRLLRIRPTLGSWTTEGEAQQF